MVRKIKPPRKIPNLLGKPIIAGGAIGAGIAAAASFISSICTGKTVQQASSNAVKVAQNVMRQTINYANSSAVTSVNTLIVGGLVNGVVDLINDVIDLLPKNLPPVPPSDIPLLDTCAKMSCSLKHKKQDSKKLDSITETRSDEITVTWNLDTESYNSDTTMRVYTSPTQPNIVVVVINGTITSDPNQRNTDFSSDALIAMGQGVGGDVRGTSRYKQNLTTMNEIQTKYNIDDSTKTYYAIGFSLGGTICDGFLLDGKASYAVTFNAAIDGINKGKVNNNFRVYADGDILRNFQSFSGALSGTGFRTITSSNGSTNLSAKNHDMINFINSGPIDSAPVFLDYETLLRDDPS
jgi:hypothetical protein